MLEGRLVAMGASKHPSPPRGGHRMESSAEFRRAGQFKPLRPSLLA